MQASQTSAPAPSPGLAKSSSGPLKYADARDLPSFPSAGLRESDAAASAAASLGWASQKSAELPSPRTPAGAPSPAASASAAALISQGNKKENHRMSSSSGKQEPSEWVSKAATLAAGGAAMRKKEAADAASSTGGESNLSPTLSWGNSAANQAFRARTTAQTTENKLAQPHAATINRRRSLRAARDAMAAGRPRATSTPTPKQPLGGDEVDDGGRATEAPDNAKPAKNATAALTAATMAHRRTLSDDGGAVPYTTLHRQQFTSQPETEETKRNEVLHASAIAMAKRMYSRQQEQDRYAEALRQARAESPTRGQSPRSPGFASDESTPQHSPLPPVQYSNLQEAAYKLAQDRLAKLHDEHQQARGGPGAMGLSTTQPLGLSSMHRRFTILNKLRRRSSSEGTVMVENHSSPRRFSLYTNGSGRANDPHAASMDAEKRQRDREALLAAAQRNVRAQMEGMDRKVFAETGKASPSLQGEMERKARALAKSRSEAIIATATVAASRDNGKVNIGGGKFMDQKEIDEIAARKVQPVLDEINEKAEKERARLAALREEEERRRREVELQRARDKEVKEIHEKLKVQQRDQDKLRKEELKQAEKERKQAEKEASAEIKRASQEEKHAHSQEPAAAIVATKDKKQSVERPRTATDPAATNEPQQSPPRKSHEKAAHKLKHRVSRLNLRLPGKSKHNEPVAGQETEQEQGPKPPAVSTPTGPAASKALDSLADDSPTSKVKTWLKAHLRPRAQSSPEPQQQHHKTGIFGSFGGGRERSGTGRLIRRKKKSEDGMAAATGGFIGGAALTGVAAAHNRQADASYGPGNAGIGAARSGAETGSSSSSLPTSNSSEADADQQPGMSSMRDVALAGRVGDDGDEITATRDGIFPRDRIDKTPPPANAAISAVPTNNNEPSGPRAASAANNESVASLNSSRSSNNHSSHDSSGLSSSSTAGGPDHFVMAPEDHMSDSSITPPRPIRDPAAPTARSTKTGSPVRNSRFLEMMASP